MKQSMQHLFWKRLFSHLFLFIRGNVVEAVGKAIGNKEMEHDGKQEAFEGKVEQKVGDVKAVFGK